MSTVRIQLRRGLADQWSTVNPTLAAGEVGIETDTNTLKFGDGETAWNDLDYALSNTVDDFQPLSEKGNAGGYASLDSSGFVPVSQLPPTAKITVNAVADQAARLALSVEAGDIAIQSDNGTTYVLSQSPASTNANWKEISATAAIASAVSAHESDTTNVHGITDTAALVTLDANQTLTAKTLASATLTGTPTAPTASAGTDTTQIATTAFVQDAIELVVGAAPAALNTLSEIAASLNDDADLSGTLTTAISEKVAKAGDTMSGVLSMGENKITSLGTPTTDYDATNKFYVDARVNNSIGLFNNITESVHGISNTANLVYTNDSRLSDQREPLALSVTSPTIADNAVVTDKVNNLAITTAKIASTAVTAEKIANDAVTADKVANDAVTTDKVAALAITAGKLAEDSVTTDKIADDAVTGVKIAANAISQSHLSDDAVGTNEIGGLAVTTEKIADDAVTTLKIADDAITTLKIANSNVTTDKINNGAVDESKIASNAVTEGKIADGSVTTAKIADSAITTGKIADGTILDADINATAAIAQSKIDGLGTALDAKLASATAATTYAPIANPTFTGTVAGVTKAHVGLGNVDNTSDANKPVSNATQTALDLKANKAAPTFTGTVTASNDLVVDGNLTVNGTTFNASSTSITIEDNMVQLAHQNSGNVVDLGIVVGYNDGAAKHAGLVRDVSDAKWKLFKGVTTEPSTTVDFTQGSLDDLQVAALQATTVTPSSGVVFSDGTQTKVGVPSLTTIGTAISAAYNLSTGGLALRDQLIPVSGAHAITVPTNATTAYPVGTSISFYQSAGADANFVEASGVTILRTPGLKLRALSSSATLTKVATDTWLLAGDLKA
jgi:hypothetical protein